jgi:sugar/nucleoside kinase (ribokinase family)
VKQAVSASQRRVVVCGPVSWNHLIYLDRLPEPVPHTQFAVNDAHALGGTSAGKALHLTGLAVPTTLHALLGADAEGRAAETALTAAGVRLVTHPSDRTERHLNLMTQGGARVSVYLATPSPASDSVLEDVERSLDAADLAILDLGEMGAALVKRRLARSCGSGDMDRSARLRRIVGLP